MGALAWRTWRFLFPNGDVSDARAAVSFVVLVAGAAAVIWTVTGGYWLLAAVLAFCFSAEPVILARLLRGERTRHRAG